MKLKTIALISAFAVAISAAAPVGATWHGDIRSYWIAQDGSTKSMVTNSPETVMPKDMVNVIASEEAKETRAPASNSAVNAPQSRGGTPVSEPSNLLMLGLGIAGLIAGRYAAKRKRKKS